ncbi:helix-turn-helix domain-containing protein [Curtobacterium sp. MCPF17_002]|uniref:TetR/AcrR family transcriptional regulator n=1 Tax=Curtobacterium sp. MCPF17_002 TaxID=2175645 RepID=UPI0021ACE2D3|nr:TetR/AcrR family transcriptional regulator [Curtobacterium sp. MCPF17_002]WIB78705.1 helix-turn-helix domain-containing protein [Curtobacterium sp. MCPF17_002]
MTDEMPHLRADARENRDRVLQAARDLFGQRGLEVTMRDVARHADVGPATLYRRFPTRQHLVDAAFEDELELCRSIVFEGAQEHDPWTGFRAVVERIVELNARNQGFVDALVAEGQVSERLARHRAELLRALAELSLRAKADGTLRQDFVVDDLLLVLLAARGLRGDDAGERLIAARRFAALALDSFREADTNARLPEPARVAAVALRGV